ncbi:MAG: helix-turn-helix transcriptional regulator [Candidatus Undinarchaeales archaeon]|nr:helix-turn-helix transcriptional regulator [Candidatus Undinarchaeales archaeon]
MIDLFLSVSARGRGARCGRDGGRRVKNRLKVYRAEHDLTQQDLAGKLGVTRQTIIAIERGKYDPSLELAFKIARHFEVSIEDVFKYEG